jgi:tetratricopeptide (TPR) repeat protein
MPDPLLTAAMIVRDEEAHLPACLASIRDLVDEIVIVDTGSSDATVSIARSFGAKVHVHPWNGNFADARNAGLELATGAWILYIDADERARPIAPDALRTRLQAATEVALRVRLRLFAGATPCWEYRLWRSDPRIRFTGKMHEKVAKALRSVSEAEGRMIGESELFLEHVGYDGDQSHKHARNLPLLRAQLADDPVDSYSWHHLAVVLDALGEAEQSDAALERALSAARETVGGAGILAFVTLIKRRRERGQDTERLLEEALARYPDSIALAWLKILAEVKAGHYEAALGRLEMFDVNADMPVEDTVAYPSEMFGPRAIEARALCLFRLERYREAAEAYAELERLEPDETAHRLKRILAAHRAASEEPEKPAALPPSAPNDFQWAARELLSGLTLDIGGVPVGVMATDAVRASAVRALFGRMRTSDRDPVVRLHFGGHRLPPPERAPDDCAGELRIWHDDRALEIAYGGHFGARVESGHASLGGYATDFRRTFHQVAPFMLGSLLAPHGRFVLHAGAIQRDGFGVLVLGGSGKGKSTLILAALQDGWSVLSDDLAVVRSGPSGPLVSGIPKPILVSGDVLDDPTPVTLDSRGRVMLPFEAWDRGSHPVGAVVIVGHGEGSTAVVQSIERPQLLGALFDALHTRQPTNLRRFFGLAAQLCDLQSFRLRHSRVSEVRVRQAAALIATRLPVGTEPGAAAEAVRKSYS